MGFKISLAGDLGSGKSTVSKIIIERTGILYYSTGAVCRAAAAEHGMTIDEFNRYMETHPEVDKRIDDDLCSLSDDPRSYILDSRMAFHFVRDTFRVYLTTSPRVSAERILNAKRDGESFGTVEETAARVAARRESENLRYFEKYGVHIMDMQNYDLVLDTSAIPPEAVADKILCYLELWQKNRNARFCELDYRRFVSREPISEALTEAVRLKIKNGVGFPFPTVRELHGAYYVEDGLEAIVANCLLKCDTVSCTLLAGPPDSPDAYQPLF